MCYYLEYSLKIWRSAYGIDSDVCISNPHNGHTDTTVANGSQRISQTKTVGQRLCSWITLRITAQKNVCLSVASRDLWKYCLMYAQDFTYSLQKGWNVCGGSGRRAEQHGRRNPVTEGTCPLLGDAIDKSGQVNRKPIQVECMSSVQQCSERQARFGAQTKSVAKLPSCVLISHPNSCVLVVEIISFASQGIRNLPVHASI